ncbi:hypothetical protein UMM65_07605 [Aureibaculum sp. 2210JD6-5]|uniref:hypothetical protein n=1 Tax=Aureibaculum sp. 2210JD6-5 TaxID=3103957 RepID=UPI002AADF5BE|nr:hypothetical protein [Aureibaculum sp. 2210JD6-5]MDY7395103.1 hypothetical protein [Aureibaculum sp. 2210JD6-5]
MFQIEDESHAELQMGKFNSYKDAINELKRRAEIPWSEKPNRCPCTSWETCGRNYVIIEYDDSRIPWKELNRYSVLEISAKGIKWTNK